MTGEEGYTFEVFLSRLAYAVVEESGRALEREDAPDLIYLDGESMTVEQAAECARAILRLEAEVDRRG